MAMASPESARELQLEIQRIEQGTDLKRVAVISRIGMKVASATSDVMDADAETASSSALIELAERLMSSLNHGHLREIVVKAEIGFVILQFIDSEYMLFAGVENPLRIGFYLEYLRNEAHKFAYILAGKQLTEELKSEIEANKRRDERLRKEAKAPLAEDFKTDKSTSDDLSAMEGVLQFLQDWGGEEETQTQVSNNNIVSIDQDVIFSSQEQISAQQLTQSESSKPISEVPAPAPFGDELDDIASLADQIQDIETTPKPESIQSSFTQPSSIGIEPSETEVSTSDEGLPDDILAVLDDIASETTTSSPSQASNIVPETREDLPYGIPIYEGEVPPVPLTDYVNFEIGSLGANHSTQAQVSGFSPDSEIASNLQSSEPESSYETVQAPILKDDGTPDFDAMSTEYDEDIDLGDDDAFLKALEEINTDKRKKKPDNPYKKNPFLE